jgi:2-polyprenyl-6-methoxyphenol hydroxylase-like FAD-dependent oxidoreductase
MPAPSPDTVAVIVGGGIAGLTTALELHAAGMPCRVLEAAASFAPLGVGLNILPHASRCLAALGLEGALTSRAVLTGESAFFNRFGQLIYREPAGRSAGYLDPQYSIHRADLHDVLLEAVQDRLGPGAVETGQRVTRFAQELDHVVVETQRRDGGEDRISATMVIGADGVNSAVRRQLFPHEGPPLYSGVTMWRGVTTASPILSGATMIRAGWLATGKMVIYPIRNDVDGRGRQLINWVAEVECAQRAERDWTRIGDLDDFRGFFADWRFDWLDVPAMLEASESVLEYPMVDQDPLPRWNHDRVTLLGDAAHPMVPRGSNGAGQAILDARALAQCLVDHGGEPAKAFDAFDAQRRPATTAVVLANRRDPPDAILREVYQRTGDRPFSRIDDVITADELSAIADRYRGVTGSRLQDLRP